GQLAGVLDEEARAAHEFVGLLGQHALVAFGAVLLVGRLVVLGLVLDDEALLQNDVEAGFDVFVLSLFGFAGAFHHCGGCRREDFDDLVAHHVIVIVIDLDDVIVLVEGFVLIEVDKGILVEIDFQVVYFGVVVNNVIVLQNGGLGFEIFRHVLLLRRHVPPEHRRAAGGFDRMVDHLIAPPQGAGGGLGGWALGSLAPSYAPDQIKQAKRSLLKPQAQPPPLTSSPRSGATATKAVNSLGGVWDRAVHYVLYGRCRQGRCLASHQGLWR